MNAKRLLVSALLAVAVLGVIGARDAAAKQVKFVGSHPIPGAGGGFCYIEVPHVHIYEPAKADVLYRKHDGAYTFVGDPVPYGYDGPKHAFYGPHPIPVEMTIGGHFGDDVDYCYLEGPHYHEYTPASGAKFVVKGGVYWYTGDFPQAYAEARPRLAQVNVVYKPLKYERPVVVVAPPPEYHGHLIEAEVVPAVVEVEAVPGHVEVVAPVPVVRGHVGFVAPSLEVQVGLPGVIVEEHHHHHHDVVVVPGRHVPPGHVKRRGKGHWKH